MKTIDAGHKFALSRLDGDGCEMLTFVKRQGVNYPGNIGAYAGTTLQEVLRACVKRIEYLDWQERDASNSVAKGLLESAIWLLEQRAAIRHSRTTPDISSANNGQQCGKCLHVGCRGECRDARGTPRAGAAEAQAETEGIRVGGRPQAGEAGATGAEMTAGRELDAMIAEKVMGVNLKPHRDVALVQVGMRQVSCTGPTFQLRNGREVPMPNGELLRKPEGVSDWNARYYLHVAEVLGEEIAVEVDVYRTAPKSYSTDIAAAWEVVEKLVSLNWQPTFAIRQFEKYPEDRYMLHGVRLVNHPGRQEFQSFSKHADTAPLAICLAALQAIEREPAHAAE